MVVDYRRLNKLTKVVQFPIPNFDDLLEKLNDAEFFIVLDLASGYLHIPLEESAKEKTAFMTETQTGEFERAMFGLINAQRYFAKLMDKILGIARRRDFALNFFDDICIFAKNWHLLKFLRFILEQLKRAGLTLNLKKCQFGERIVNYLGYRKWRNSTGNKKCVCYQRVSATKRQTRYSQIYRFSKLLSSIHFEIC